MPAELGLALANKRVLYTSSVRRIQIYLDESVDEALQSEAARTGRSKASLIRECVAGRYGRRTAQPAADPLDQLIGAFDVDPAPVDEVVYGPAGPPPTGPRKSSASSGGKSKARGPAR